ncbi:hypothetical protein [Neptuniibacter sp.]|uniref:hypothetical protein n=1 Tax=Neptuniibacter sp. TaxID=1962643 RepID=UPI003B5C8C0A
MTLSTAENLYDDEIVINDAGQGVLVLPRSERYLHCRLGYEIEIKDELGEWVNDIVVPDDNGKSHHFYTSNLFTDNHELNQILDSFLKRAFKIYMPNSMGMIQKGLEEFARAYAEKNGNIAFAFEKAFTDLAITEKTESIGPLKKLISYMIASEVPNFHVDAAAELCGASIGQNKNQYMALFTMDSEAGPFTREELSIIDQSLLNEDAPLDSRCIMALCRDFGLRPIQISLLKVSDLHHNPQNGQYWLNVPRVKQKVKERRKEFRRRFLSQELAEMLNQMIEADRWIVEEFEQNDPPLFQRHYRRDVMNIDGIELSRSDFFDSASNPHAHLYADERKDYSHHIHTNGIRWRLGRMERFLPLSPRTGSHFNLNAYRFRYTLGTSAVLQGMTAPEVADLLDHSSTECVQHYFKNTREFWELIEKATSSRVEQKHFAVAFMTRNPEDEDNIYAVDITEKKMFTSVGKCFKGSPCALEPAVACYGCETFKPNNDLQAHKNAKEVILEMDERQKSLSSEGHIQRQYEDALAGVEAAIVIAKGEGGNVVGIHDSPAQPFGLENEFTAPMLEVTEVE